MAKRIKLPITLRITEAELLESQSAEDDLRAVAQQADGPVDGEPDGGGTKCQTKYCEAGYSSGLIEEAVLDI
jgi:hypothetical protein